MVLRPLLMLACLASIVSVALNLLASKIGSLQPPNPALAGFVEGCEDKPQPCWYGIVPGIEFESAIRVIEHLGYELSYAPANPFEGYLYVSKSLSPQCVELWHTDDARHVGSLIFSCFEVNLGEIIALLGNPIYIEANDIQGDSLNFANAFARVRQGWNSPNAPITVLRLSAISRTYDAEPFQILWGGFKPLWSYCRYKPSFSPCL